MREKFDESRKRAPLAEKARSGPRCKENEKQNCCEHVVAGSAVKKAKTGCEQIIAGPAVKETITSKRFRYTPARFRYVTERFRYVIERFRYATERFRYYD